MTGEGADNSIRSKPTIMKKKRCKTLHCRFKVEFSFTSNEQDNEIRQRTRHDQTARRLLTKRKGKILPFIVFGMRLAEIIKAMF